MNDILQPIADHINNTTHWKATIDTPNHLHLTCPFPNDTIGITLKGQNLHIPTLACSLGYGTDTNIINLADPTSLDQITQKLQSLLPDPPPKPHKFSIEQEVVRNPLLQLALLTLLALTWPIRATIKLFR